LLHGRLRFDRAFFTIDQQSHRIGA
jgi:hypothetical protein